MRPNPIAGTLVLVFALIAACADSTPLSPAVDHPPLFATAPADGNGNKQVFPISIHDQRTCPNGAILNRHLEGWVQVRIFAQAGNRNVELDVFHLLITFTNSAGESFVWRSTDADRYWVEDGNLMVSVPGRTGGHIGVFIVNLATGDVVFDSGQDLGPPRDQACAALT